MLLSDGDDDDGRFAIMKTVSEYEYEEEGEEVPFPSPSSRNHSRDTKLCARKTSYSYEQILSCQ